MHHFPIVNFWHHIGSTVWFTGLIGGCFIGSELPTEYKFLARDWEGG